MIKYVMSTRKALLGRLVPGDIIHAESPNGASLICLVVETTQTTIMTRTVTTQLEYEFDISSGIALFGEDAVPCTIDSIAPLPPDIHRVMLQLDNKFRFETDVEKAKLTESEIHGLLFIAKFYAENQIS